MFLCFGEHLLVCWEYLVVPNHLLTSVTAMQFSPCEPPEHERPLHSVGVSMSHDREEQRPILVAYFSHPQGVSAKPTVVSVKEYKADSVLLSRSVRSTIPIPQHQNFLRKSRQLSAWVTVTSCGVTATSCVSQVKAKCILRCDHASVAVSPGQVFIAGW